MGALVEVYAGVWGLSQVASSALADRVGRKRPIAVGTFRVKDGLVVIFSTTSESAWSTGVAVIGSGMVLA